MFLSDADPRPTCAGRGSSKFRRIVPSFWTTSLRYSLRTLSTTCVRRFHLPVASDRLSPCLILTTAPFRPLRFCATTRSECASTVTERRTPNNLDIDPQREQGTRAAGAVLERTKQPQPEQRARPKVTEPTFYSGSGAVVGPLMSGIAGWHCRPVSSWYEAAERLCLALQ